MNAAASGSAARHPSHARRDLGDFRPQASHHRNAYREVQQGLNRQDRIALAVTGAVGTMYAVYVLAMFMVGWMFVQVALGRAAFDPYPFAFLLFLGNIVQLLLMPLLMVGQNLQGRHSEARATSEFETVGKIFHDLEATMRHLDVQDQELLRQTRLITSLVETLVPAAHREQVLESASAGLTAAGKEQERGPSSS